MFFSDSIKLRLRTYPTSDTVGFPNNTDVDTTVWANRVSVGRTEFYSAGLNGIDVVRSYEVHVEDFSDQNMVVDGTDEFFIVRSFQKGLGIVVLTCSDKAV
jgi:hypothetical protein